MIDGMFMVYYLLMWAKPPAHWDMERKKDICNTRTSKLQQSSASSWLAGLFERFKRVTMSSDLVTCEIFIVSLTEQGM